jgi:hypothetical protein
MSAFRRAAQAAFERAFARVPGTGAEVERASIDVALGGVREIVSFTLRGGELSWSCTCAQEACAHAQAALALLGGLPARAEVPATRSSQTDLVAVNPDRRTVEPAAPSAEANTAELREVLSDLITAVVRSGSAGGLSPTVEEALGRLARTARSPLPHGLNRWGGRLKRALTDADNDEVARLLHGASQLVGDLQAAAPAPAARSRLLSWLGTPAHDDSADVMRLTDVSMLELAREWVPALERAGIERRYLLDLQHGEIYCEERAPSAAGASLGPCPRQLTVWLSLVEPCAPPKRARLLQYAVTPVIEEEAWQSVAQRAQRDFDAVIARYRETLATFAGLCEPVALLAPARFDADAPLPALIDAHGRELQLQCSPSLLAHVRRTLANADVLWMAGRLVDRFGLLGFLPLSAAVLRHGRLCYARM